MRVKRNQAFQRLNLSRRKLLVLERLYRNNERMKPRVAFVKVLYEYPNMSVKSAAWKCGKKSMVWGYRMLDAIIAGGLTTLLSQNFRGNALPKARAAECSPLSIIKSVCQIYKITPQTLKLRSKERHITIPRGVCIYILHKCGHSYRQIAKMFGMALSSVQDANESTADLILMYPDHRYNVQLLERWIEKVK